MKILSPVQLPSNSKLTVLSQRKGEFKGKFTIIVTAQCECGTIKDFAKSTISGPGNKTISCGCYKKQFEIYKGASSHKFYLTWRSMIDRCYKPTDKYYHRYGGKGVTVCDEWRNDPWIFLHWADQQYWEKGYQIDRKDNEGIYKPDNCRFVPPIVNSNNRSSNIVYTYKGVQDTIANWARKYGLGYRDLHTRLRINNWLIELALETP